MRDLHQALADITAIRGQIARGTEFRGYGPAALFVTAMLALLAAAAQAHWIGDPMHAIGAYLALWITTAALCVLVVGIETVRRTRRMHDGLADDMLRAAVESFLPAATAGVLLTLVLLHSAAEELWMLPGLWQILFSLGAFASCRSLPRPMIAVALWYLGAGLSCLTLANGSDALSPWTMGAPFCIGQLLAAALLKQSFGAGDGES
jgi:hypothetical protein